MMENNLPQGWAWFDMLDVINYEGGSQPPKKVFVYEPQKGYVRLIQIRDYGNKPFPTYIPDSSRLKKVEEDDLLIARYGGSSANDSLGRICSGISGAYNVALAKVIFPKDYLNTSFVRYLLSGHWFLDRLNSLSRSCQTGFNRDDLQELYFPLPPLSEQNQIVFKLDALMQKVESNKHRLEKIPKLLKRFRQSVLAAAVCGELTEDWRIKNGILDEWGVKTLNQIGKITGGVTLNSKRQLLALKLPYLRVANVYSNQILLDEVKTIGVLKQEIKRALLEPGDLLIVEGNGSADQIGRVAQWHGEIPNCLHQNHLIKFRSKDSCDAKYVLYFLLSLRGREQIEEASKSTSGLYTLSISKVSALIINFPTINEQNEIVRRIEQLFAFADKIEARYTKAKAMLDKLPQSILAKAFRGELVPQDTNDEPASVLLERIKAEKEKKTSFKKINKLSK